MTDIRQLPAQQERVETGPVQFGDDWPGAFIRGDHAGWYAMQIKRLLESDLPLDFLLASNLRNLQPDLGGCVVGSCREMVIPAERDHADKLIELEHIANGAEQVLSGGWSMEYGFHSQTNELGYWIMPREPDASYEWAGRDRRVALRKIGEASCGTNDRATAPKPSSGPDSGSDCRLACPCTLTNEPCSPKCGCRNPQSSFACLACTGYGSTEQRKQQANRIIQAVRRSSHDGTTQQ